MLLCHFELISLDITFCHVPRHQHFDKKPTSCCFLWRNGLSTKIYSSDFSAPTISLSIEVKLSIMKKSK